MVRSAMRLTVTGRVQGVGYRAWALAQARALGLEGWVRNRRDGAVEALALGPDAALSAFAAACERGPPHAAVLSVRRAAAEDDGSRGFEQRATL